MQRLMTVAVATTAVALVGILAYSAIFGTHWIDPPLTPAIAGAVTLENWQRLRVGMTEAEIEVILGGPGTFVPLPNHFTTGPPRPTRVWHGKTGDAYLSIWDHPSVDSRIEGTAYYGNFVVSGSSEYINLQPPDTILGSIGRWLGW